MRASTAVETDGEPTHFWKLALGSVGVVYGDIGTSPLYALREGLHAAGRDGLDEAEVIGIVSLLLWTLTLIVTLKYVVLILRADNRGEGGTLSLLALAQRAVGRRTPILFVLGVLGAALFYGDAAITPAISVLSAVEGFELVAPGLDAYVVPITVAIIVGAVLGAEPRHRQRLGAVRARHAGLVPGDGAARARRTPATGWRSSTRSIPAMPSASSSATVSAALPVMGSVFLAVTGAEALYADMGHFGRGPIRVAWLGLVFPALALNYLGQGSLVLARPETVENPFFLMAPGWGLLPLVILATAATIIASQAVISGAFSLTRQAVQLGLLPRLEIQHTSESQVGQVYMPRVNWTLLAAVLILVFAFRSSSALASAYGIAVTGTMVVTSLLAFTVFRRAWALAAAGGPRGARAAARDRVHLPRREPRQAARRRLRAADHRRDRRALDDDLGPRHPHRQRQGARGERSARSADRDAEEVAPGPRPGHRACS